MIAIRTRTIVGPMVIAACALTSLVLVALPVAAQTSEPVNTGSERVSHANDSSIEPAFDAEGSSNQMVSAGVSETALTLRSDGSKFTLEFSGGTRRQVVERLFAASGVAVTWRGTAGAEERIEGRHVGSLEEIASRLLSHTNYIVAYDMTGSAPRMTGVVIYSHDGQAATQLEDGRVLITSGNVGNVPGCPGPGGPIADAEVYDPVSGTFSSAGGMISGRYKHNQIRLDDGHVLVAGGMDGCIASNTGSAELFDPSTNQFTLTGSMSIGRSLFPMHKLPDGDVVVFGGEISGGFAESTDRIEKYDVATGQWSIVGYLSQRKGGMGSCALADGTFLLVGGHNRFNDSDPVRTKSAEIFDPATNITRLLPTRTNFEHKRSVRGLTLQDGRCLIASEGFGIEVELFDPATETFSIVPPLPEFENISTSSYSMSMLPDGTVLHVASPSMIFDPTSNSIELVPH